MLFQDADSFNTFFALLRSGLYGAPIRASELPESIDWKAVNTFAQRQAVLGIIIESVQFLPDHLRPSATVAARMSKFALSFISRNIVLDNTAAQLVTFLSHHDITGVLIKGQGVARYYRLPHMRQCGDIDFYVGKTLYDKALHVCTDEFVGDGGLQLDNEQHSAFYINGVLIELHRLASRIYRPFCNRRFQQWVVDELEHSLSRRTFSVGGTDITLPSYDFDALFIFYHAWRHYVMEGGVGLRQLCDWAMIFHTRSNDIDHDKLLANIRRFGMTKGWKLFACIAVDRLGVSPDKMPLYDPTCRKQSERVFRDIVAGGNFGHYTTNAGGPVLAKSVWDGLGKIGAATRNLVRFFPLIPAESLYIYFNYVYDGTASFIGRSLHKFKKHHH